MEFRCFRMNRVENARLVGETEKAYKIEVERVGGKAIEWLPKSQSQIVGEAILATDWICSKKRLSVGRW